jgi:hypothetical protein
MMIKVSEPYSTQKELTAALKKLTKIKQRLKASYGCKVDIELDETYSSSKICLFTVEYEDGCKAEKDIKAMLVRNGYAVR